MSLFDSLRRKKTGVNGSNTESKTVASPLTAGEVPTTDEEETIAYYFENLNEFAIYVQKFAKGKEVIWRSGDNYLKEYQKGYQLFEQRQLNKAIETYKNCLKLNPIGISARFEMCEAYLQLHNISLAKQALLDMKGFMIDKKDIAKFYRRFGFIQIEQGNYREAAACYQYSLEFENHPLVNQELMFIKSKGGRVAATGDSKKILLQAGIPILPEASD